MESAHTALSLLFRKLHPVLEDTAHALATGAPLRDLEKLHLKLLRARFAAVEALEALPTEGLDPALAEAVEELAANLTPMGETFQQSLVLTQLCLEDAPDTFLPFIPEPERTEAPWARRLEAFQSLITNPAHQAETRWTGIDPDIGEAEEA